jgi:arginine:pyruvate transaminase
MGLNGASGDDGWGLFYKARQMIRQGIAVTELTIGEHDIRTAPPVLEAMHKSAMGGHTGYAVVPGTDALRARVAARVTERTGVPTTPQNVLITPGGQSALFAAHMAVIDPGETALFIDPYYATYPGTLRAAGAVAHPIRARAENGFEPNASDIAVAAPGARSLLINSPNNPTGAVYSAQCLSGIAGVVRANDLWLISDEVYDIQVWDGSHLSPRALPEMAERTLVVGSMSKSHAMTGSRCGWLIGPDWLIARLIDLATVTTYGVPGYIQDAAAFALDQGPDLENAIAAPFRRRRAIAKRILDGQNAVVMQASKGAMYIMLDIRRTGLTSMAFADALLDEEHIAVMPGESFGASAQGFLRIAMTVDDASFEDALKRLVAFAKAKI